MPRACGHCQQVGHNRRTCVVPPRAEVERAGAKVARLVVEASADAEPWDPTPEDAAVFVPLMKRALRAPFTPPGGVGPWRCCPSGDPWCPCTDGLWPACRHAVEPPPPPKRAPERRVEPSSGAPPRREWTAPEDDD